MSNHSTAAEESANTGLCGARGVCGGRRGGVDEGDEDADAEDENGEDVDDGDFTAAGKAGGRERASATTLSLPVMCWISEVYSAMYERCLVCLGVLGADDDSTVVSGR